MAQDADLADRVHEELADIVIYCLWMADQLDIDLQTSLEEKLSENENRFEPDTDESLAEDLRK